MLKYDKMGFVYLYFHLVTYSKHILCMKYKYLIITSYFESNLAFIIFKQSWFTYLLIMLIEKHVEQAYITIQINQEKEEIYIQVHRVFKWMTNTEWIQLPQIYWQAVLNTWIVIKWKLTCISIRWIHSPMLVLKMTCLMIL